MFLITRMPPGAPRNKPMDARMTAAESEPGVVLTQDIRVLAGLVTSSRKRPEQRVL